MIVAIDGPSAAGKGTLARRLAEALDFAYLDTGTLYRAVAARVLAQGNDPGDDAAAARAAASLRLAELDSARLRGDAIAQAASRVAAHPAVREALLALQRRFAQEPPAGKAGAVLDGRDIGTVVCPAAEVKLFVTASPEVRAARRHKELRERGEASIYARVLAEMRERDKRDSERSAAPLRPAADAVVLDTSNLDPEQAFRAAVDIVAPRLARDRRAPEPGR
jgi:cytidylate kinase